MSHIHTHWHVDPHDYMEHPHTWSHKEISTWAAHQQRKKHLSDKLFRKIVSTFDRATLSEQPSKIIKKRLKKLDSETQKLVSVKFTAVLEQKKAMQKRPLPSITPKNAPHNDPRDTPQKAAKPVTTGLQPEPAHKAAQPAKPPAQPQPSHTLQTRKPAEIDRPSPAIRQISKGLQNHIGNTCLDKCYFYALLKSLLLNHSFRTLLEQEKTPTADCLKKLFSALETERGDVLLFEDERLQNLLNLIAKKHPEILERRQEDAAIALSWILDPVFGEKLFVSHEDRKERDRDVHTNVCVPSLDLPSTNTGAYIPIHATGPQFDLQQEFLGRVTSDVIDKSAVKHSEYNTGRGHAVDTALQHMGPTASFVTCKILTGNLPHCLVFQINRALKSIAEKFRSMSESELRALVDPSIRDLPLELIKAVLADTHPTKSAVRVTVPQQLSVYHSNQASHTQHTYTLSSVVVHIGTTDNVGHYITIEPPKKKGDDWIRHDDERVTKISIGEASLLIENEGYLVFYSKTS